MNLISTAPISPDAICPDPVDSDTVDSDPIDTALAALAAAGIGFDVIDSGAGRRTADFDVAA